MLLTGNEAVVYGDHLYIDLGESDEQSKPL